MATLDDILRQRWTMMQPEDVVGLYVPGNAIPDYWRAHPDLGSPIAAETDLDGIDGGRVQAFTGGVVTWDATNGVQVVSG